MSDQLYVYQKLVLSVACRQFMAVLGAIFTFLFVVDFKYFVDVTMDFGHISVLYLDRRVSIRIVTIMGLE